MNNQLLSVKDLLLKTAGLCIFICASDEFSYTLISDSQCVSWELKNG